MDIWKSRNSTKANPVTLITTLRPMEELNSHIRVSLVISCKLIPYFLGSSLIDRKYPLVDLLLFTKAFIGFFLLPSFATKIRTK
ncbi:hypothetical protein HMPREF1869_01043 [Bacteroidales bacterium KA00251]|nr:hypothetical protein HMPREF1869_01043 [Bacteroidales bacterium KA00251]